MITYVHKKVVRLDVTRLSNTGFNFKDWMLSKQSTKKDLFSTLPYFKLTNLNDNLYIDLVVSLKYDDVTDLFEMKRELYSEEGENYYKLFKELIGNDFSFDLFKNAQFINYNSFAKKPKDYRSEN